MLQAMNPTSFLVDQDNFTAFALGFRACGHVYFYWEFDGPNEVKCYNYNNVRNPFK